MICEISKTSQHGWISRALCERSQTQTTSYCILYLCVILGKTSDGKQINEGRGGEICLKAKDKTF